MKKRLIGFATLGLALGTASFSNAAVSFNFINRGNPIGADASSISGYHGYTLHLHSDSGNITAVDFSSLELAPCYDPISHLVYVAGREHVSHVWVNGRMLLDDGELTTLDERELLQRAHFWRERMASNEGQQTKVAG